MLIQYKPGPELAIADALLCLYVRATRGENGLSPDWPLLVLRTKDKGFPPDTTNITKKTVIKSKHLFAEVYGTLHRKMSNGTTIPYIPTHQQVVTIIQYHRDLGHTKSSNLYKFLKHKVWWSTLYCDVQEVLDQYEVCKKFAKSKAPPKSVLPICAQLPFKMWALSMVGPMPGVVNTAIHHVLILPLLGYFEDKSLSFAFAL
ncbi:hypothetical protein DSO57_1005785 [Entomophthora muscae]|uniref:Uncharacterized protein n=1 Tax=Entomophthora muscae TaxID=34485 RepID=A0ACC2SX22_9FUNG|nr:hypothetical protein DSO57_1005785 [Entomophthora muscae]